jgi:hypothetical protein
MIPRTRRPWRGAALALLLGCAAAMGLAEAWVRRIQLDSRLVAQSLWWQSVDVDACQVSEDPFLHYELRPGTSLAKQGPWGPYRITVNTQGARGGPATPLKPPDTLRLLCFGGSSMFGAGVGDEETVCTRLALHLEALGVDPPHVQPWNFGTNAYNLAQVAHLARARIDDLEPDLVLVLLSNTGRRPFLLTPAVAAGDRRLLTGMDGWLHEENLPTPSWLTPRLHHFALGHSALYRAWAGHRALTQHGTGPVSAVGDALSRHEAARLSTACTRRGLPLLYAAIPAAFHHQPDDIHPGLPAGKFLDLDDPGQPPSYREVHPPPAILDVWARRIAEAMVARRMVAVVPPPPSAMP